MIQCCGRDIAQAKMRTENQSVHILQCRRKEGAFNSNEKDFLKRGDLFPPSTTKKNK